MVKFRRKDLECFRLEFISLCRASVDTPALQANLMAIHGLLKLLVLATHLGGYHVSVQRLVDTSEDGHYFLGTLCQTFLEVNKKDQSAFCKEDLREFATNIVR